MRQYIQQIASLLASIGFATTPLLLADTPAPSTTVAATPAAKPATSPTDVDPREKLLLHMGFKPRMVSGQKLFCRREMELGSRVRGTTHCGTVDQLTTEFQQSRDAIDQAQRYGTNPTG